MGDCRKWNQVQIQYFNHQKGDKGFPSPKTEGKAKDQQLSAHPLSQIIPFHAAPCSCPFISTVAVNPIAPQKEPRSIFTDGLSHAPGFRQQPLGLVRWHAIKSDGC